MPSCPQILTVIITLRASSAYDMIGRLRYRQADTERPLSVTFLVVDEGSSAADSELIRKECLSLDFQYLRFETGKDRFCAATARNVGAIAATTDYIIHEDIDIFPYPGFYRELLEEISIQKVTTRGDGFITVPILYLSEKASRMALSGDISKNNLIHHNLMGSTLVNTYLPASSVILVGREYYLKIGGYNENFDGWGLEDLEYAYRLTHRSSLFPRPSVSELLSERDFASNTSYIGWRAKFRLHGDLLARKGIVAFHAHHPKDRAWTNTEMHQKNRILYDDCVARFESGGQYLHPLVLKMPDQSDASLRLDSNKLSTFSMPPAGSSESFDVAELKNLNLPHEADDDPHKKIEIAAAQPTSIDAPIYDLYRRWIMQHADVRLLRSLGRPKHIRRLTYAGRTLHDKGRFLEAGMIFDFLAAEFPDEPGYSREAAEAYFAAGQKKVAISRLTKARQLKPGNHAIRRRLLEMKFGFLPLRFQKPYRVK